MPIPGAVMARRCFLIWLLLAATLAAAPNKVEDWLEVRSEHFTVATNASEKQGRRVADQFERMRSVFQATFPKLQIDSGTPIIVLAITNEKDFRALEPAAYLAKGQLRLGGLFLRAPDKNYVLMSLDAEGEHPYAVIYHEYTHLLLSKAADWLPLWLNEGLAEFYQNTEIREKDVALGEPDAENLMILRQNRLLPLATLLTVDEKSPYYHEENKGSIFYAEAWALTHYILVRDRKDNLDRMKAYQQLVANGADSLSAASTAFGDLKQLQSDLESYVRQGSYTYFKLPANTGVDDSTFQVQALTLAQADALRGDFLAYNDRPADARPLLDRALREDPKNALAHETMGYLEFQERNLDEARKWYTEAVELDSHSYLAHYYFAAITMHEGVSRFNEAQVESSLRTAIKLNPTFAPTYDRLAVLLETRGGDLKEAHTMSLTAVKLDPADAGYRINLASVLLAMHQSHDAIEVLRTAEKLAKTSEESGTIKNMFLNAQFLAENQDQADDLDTGESETTTQVSTEKTTLKTEASHPESTHHETFVPLGPHRFLSGVLRNVHCDLPALDLSLESPGKSLALHSENYYKIQFTTLGFTPKGNLNPCLDLEGRPAKVEYVESANKSASPRVLSIELHK
jgi:Tfp pilus assembly protein PilF